MEKIIIYVIIIAAGVLFDFIKKRARKSATSQQANKPPKPQAQFPLLQFSDLNIPRNKPELIPSDKHETAPGRVIKQEPEKIKHDKLSAAFLPGEKEISLPDITDDTPMEISKQEVPADVAAHYARWRQAILDAEILQRKF